jgi:hypothetical protein
VPHETIRAARSPATRSRKRAFADAMRRSAVTSVPTGSLNSS